MAKKLVLITQAASTCPTYAQRLHQFFGSNIALECFSVEAGDFPAMPTDADLYITAATSSDAFAQIMDLIPEEGKVVSPAVTFFKKDIETLRQLPRGTRAMLVNLSVQMSYESIAELNRLGITQVEFTPVYPGSSYPTDVALAITPGEGQYVPPTALRVIDLGPRVFTADTLLEIALKLGFTWFPKSAEFRAYADSLADQGQSLASLWSANLKAESYLDILMGALETGILGVDVDSRIFALNDLAENMLGLRRKEAIGQPFPLACRDLARQLTENDRRQKTSRLIQLKDTYLNLSTAPVDWQGEYIGCFLVLQRFTEEEERQHQFRLQMYHRGYQSKYVFDDIVGQSDIMLRTKQIAAKMAATDSSILLTGESGTGKELFAHSIHNASPRRNMPFVAINCAALSDSLLESELFGYDEGAFTGAKKGGKLGLFEYAHRGTLFLDEIEGMSQPLQIKLLRVLQEKEFMRVGGNRIIPTDVRIIAASNEDILERVRQGTFRKDLYYRLNTLPISIPPLRDRGEDLFLIAEHLMARSGVHFTLAPSAQTVLRAYGWDGNVRELANLVEYLSMLGKDFVEAEELPPYLRAVPTVKPPQPEAAPQPSPGSRDFWQAAHGREELFCFLVRAMGGADRGIGRGALLLEARRQRVPATEQEIRDVLLVLHRLGLVSVSRGRGGSRLTQKGLILYQELSPNTSK